MASIFNKRGKYWLKYKHPVTRTWKIKPTPLIYPQDARKAKELKTATTAAELGKSASRIPNDQRWNSWVPQYLAERYTGEDHADTYNRYLNSWGHLSSYLDFKGIASPAAWKLEHNMGYVAWKTAEARTMTGDKVLKKKMHRSKNVAIWDLGVLAMLMNEAKRRGFIDKRDKILVSKARIAKEERPPKPAVTDAEIATIRAALSKGQTLGPENERTTYRNMATAFETALYTGCRIAETSIPFTHLSLDRGTITWIPKGGEKRAFTTPIIFPEFIAWLKPVVAQRRKGGHTTTCDVSGQTSRNFGRLCDRLKLGHITMHCLRVTFVTRALEGGLDGEVVRKMVGHSDALINRIYQRFSIAGLQGLGEKLRMPGVAAPAPLKN